MVGLFVGTKMVGAEVGTNDGRLEGKVVGNVAATVLETKIVINANRVFANSTQHN